MFKKLGLSLIALSFVVSAQARIPQNLRIVPGSEMIVNQTREAIEDLQEIHQISFQSGMLVYFATALEEIGSDKALAANAELIAALSQLAGKEVDEDSADMMAFWKVKFQEVFKKAKSLGMLFASLWAQPKP